MAKLYQAVEGLDPIPGLEGARAAPIPLERIQEMQNLGADVSPTQMILWLSEHLIRDENGDRFEDMLTEQDVMALPYSFVCQIIEGCTNYIRDLAPGEKKG